MVFDHTNVVVRATCCGLQIQGIEVCHRPPLSSLQSKAKSTSAPCHHTRRHPDASDHAGIWLCAERVVSRQICDDVPAYRCLYFWPREIIAKVHVEKLSIGLV
jgi:hypothetical protein